ncbi:putative beta-lysine N-acetyltransferase [Sutcliffiella deserti]|uniref:putative beta-lysine N-acetyltransferase n=1 Tax=Sutcliffiella deserti TaxID=2875501 RepID=UPI001CBEC5CD|nr:putative beta-lysine N-acetyltransferase [Sutcliffiella deserti]
MKKAYGEKLNVKNNSFQLVGSKDFFNERLKIEDFQGDIGKVADLIEKLQMEEYVKKTIVKSRKENLLHFIKLGYALEAVLPNYYSGSEVYFLCKYQDQSRYLSDKWLKEDLIMEEVRLKKRTTRQHLPSSLRLRKATISDANNLASFYANVFPIYPVPIEDPNYIKDQILGDSIFHLIEEEGNIIAAASAEVNRRYGNAEITDCATLPTYRKGGYMYYLIESLEKELSENQVFCCYSIARALSFGMNMVLHNLAYSYTGRLKNNCYIFDKIEDMNVWFKDLSNPAAEK